MRFCSLKVQNLSLKKYLLIDRPRSIQSYTVNVEKMTVQLRRNSFKLEHVRSMQARDSLCHAPRQDYLSESTPDRYYLVSTFSNVLYIWFA